MKYVKLSYTDEQHAALAVAASEEGLDVNGYCNQAIKLRLSGRLVATTGKPAAPATGKREANAMAKKQEDIKARIWSSQFEINERQRWLDNNAAAHPNYAQSLRDEITVEEEKIRKLQAGLKP